MSEKQIKFNGSTHLLDVSLFSGACCGVGRNFPLLLRSYTFLSLVLPLRRHSIGKTCHKEIRRKLIMKQNGSIKRLGVWRSPCYAERLIMSQLEKGFEAHSNFTSFKLLTLRKTLPRITKCRTSQTIRTKLYSSGYCLSEVRGP